MDLEGYAKSALRRGEKDIEERMAQRILEIKERIHPPQAISLARAVVKEARASLNPDVEVLEYLQCGVTMGEFGVGSRGLGDFYTHEEIARIIGPTGAVVDSSHLDDSGVVDLPPGRGYLVATVDGLHSRLSDFPFLAGFHAARAALRDILVMGASPLAMLSDIHVADDGDVAKVFDHVAGIATIAEATRVPLVSGSTLRIGGDMVLGERLTGGVAAVGHASHLTARVAAEPGDVILMTEGAGGGTVSTTAIYNGRAEVVEETLNVKFIEAAQALLEGGLTSRIHVMTDVTNGGIRGDAREITRTAGVSLVFWEEKLRGLVNTRVLEMLESLEIDYLGVSLDSLLVICPPDVKNDVITAIQDKDVKIDEVGRVEEGRGAYLVKEGEKVDFTPRFRESAYTPVKKVVGEHPPPDLEKMKKQVSRAADEAIIKKKKILRKLKVK